MNSEQFRGVVVQKPWGSERLLYSNTQIELWHLHIDYNQRTSFHCHPIKKTGLVVLGGQAAIRFMNDSITLLSLGKVMLRPGLFHQTTCLSVGGLDLLEIETPPDKSDLVRLDDPYGRVSEAYESSQSYIKTEDNIRLDEATKSGRIGDCSLTVLRPAPGWLLPDGQLGMVLSGGFVAAQSNKFVLSAGDVVNDHTYRILAASFAARDLELLIVSGDQYGRSVVGGVGACVPCAGL